MNAALIAAAALPAPDFGPWGSIAPDNAYISPSQITGYLNCSASWHYKYKLKLPETKTGALALGRAVHSAIEGYLSLRARGGELEAHRAEGSVVRGFIVDQPLTISMSARAHCANELRTAELREDEDAAELCAKASEMAEAFHRQASTITPAMIPGPTGPRPAIEVELHGHIAGVPVRGIADCITADGQILDFKTSGRSPSGISNAHRIQLSTYAEIVDLHQAKIVTITKAAAPKVIEQTTPILQSDREHVRELFPIVADAMSQGFAIPNRTSTFCSRKYCSFWRTCQEDYGGTVAA
jgi:putative RecB family exonuclease